MNGGFHQEQTMEEQKSLSEGLLNRDWNTFAIEHNGVKDDNRFTFYLSEDMPKQVKRFVRKTIKKIDNVTEYKIARTRREDIADVLVDDVDNYDVFGEDVKDAVGLAFFDPNDNYQLNATWLTSNYTDMWTNKRGKVRLGKITKHIIVHEMLHTLGLSHPFGEGRYEGVTNADSVMSYHFHDWTIKEQMRPADIEALQTFWGKPTETVQSDIVSNL